MLHDFVAEHREEIIRRCRARVSARSIPTPTPAELEYGVPRFLDQLIEGLLRRFSSNAEIDHSASRHGRELLLQGFTVSQVVHDYGDVCQSITDLALEMNAPIDVEEFRTLNQCLDDAIASAVTEYGRQRDQSALDAAYSRDEQRFGFFVHEMRNLLNTAQIAFEVLKAGGVGVSGSTGSVLKRSLAGLRDLVTRSVAEVQLRHAVLDRVDVGVSDFIDEVAAGAAMDVSERGLQLIVQCDEIGVVVHADRQVLSAVVVNLLQNACKFTRPATRVWLRVVATPERVRIEIEDECGGLPDGNTDALFTAYERRGEDRTGLGLGLAFSRWGAEVNGGHIAVVNHPNRGCAFTVDLPRAPDRLLALT